MTLVQLKEALEKGFAPPFLPRGTVEVKWEKENAVLNVRIGRRDISINEQGVVVGAGTMLVGYEPNGVEATDGPRGGITPLVGIPCNLPTGPGAPAIRNHPKEN